MGQAMDEYLKNKAIDLLIADGYSDYMLEDMPDHMLVRVLIHELIHEYIKAKNRIKQLDEEKMMTEIERLQARLDNIEENTYTMEFEPGIGRGFYVVIQTEGTYQRLLLGPTAIHADCWIDVLEVEKAFSDVMKPDEFEGYG
jgi:hypothetical protein